MPAALALWLTELRPALESGLRALGLELPATAQTQLLIYIGELYKWNSAYNLTAVRDPQGMLARHVLDSLSVLPLVSGRLLDVGAGAGLPGIILAIANPALNVSVLDSNGKKARFMRHAVRTLGLTNVQVEEARVDALKPTQGFDCITSRAFASLGEFFDATAHLLAPGGQWLAMKGKLEDAELAAVPGSVQILETRRLSVPGLPEARHVVIAALH
ncbi:MAG: 16S rRNA (guanine(527)-N(7))-methyltransferase RsmG [Pseudomonadota bacterium]|nr:16S rRNA (guanine(527)-N(7))-methyltransferase RsmG [Pseudomonadota bacterium]